MLHNVVSSGYLPKEGVQQRQGGMVHLFLVCQEHRAEVPVHQCLCDWTVSNILDAYACSFTVDAVCFKCCLRQKYKDLCFFVCRLYLLMYPNICSCMSTPQSLRAHMGICFTSHHFVLVSVPV